jgi:hypothetical protein
MHKLCLPKGTVYSVLKKKIVTRAMSRGPIARKKKSIVHVRLGVNRLRLFGRSYIST